MMERKAMRKAERVAFRNAACEASTKIVTNDTGAHVRLKPQLATKKASKARREANSEASNGCCQVRGT